LVAVLVATVVTVRSLTWKAPVIPPTPEPQSGLQCFRQGGDRDYCGCLDRMAAARARAGRPKPRILRLDDPAIQYALRHPQRYPIVNTDTPRCLTPRVSPPKGVIAGTLREA
jgi:hypothetical protein